MTIAYRGGAGPANLAVAAAATNDVSITLPVGTTTGDVVLLWCVVRLGTGATIAADAVGGGATAYTLETTITNTGVGDYQNKLYWHTVISGETAVEVTLSGGTGGAQLFSAGISVYSGADTTDPIASSSNVVHSTAPATVLNLNPVTTGSRTSIVVGAWDITAGGVGSGLSTVTADWTSPDWTDSIFRMLEHGGTYPPGSTVSPSVTINSAQAWHGTTIVLQDANVAPTAPTLNSPVGTSTVDLGTTQRFSWTFNDPNAGDSQSAFDLRYKVVGAGSWTVVSGATPNNYVDFAPSTLTDDDFEWQVRTYDAVGTVGPYSSSAFFTAANDPAAPTITSPTSGGTVATNPANVTWSAAAQDSYQVRKVADNAGAADTGTVYYDSGEVVNAVTRTVSLAFPTNSRYEHLQVRVKVSGLWSTWASIRVQVSYTPPATPTLIATAVTASASISVAIANPVPSGGQPTVDTNDVWRRETSVGGDGIRLARDVATNATWVDRTPASAVAYQYKIVANGSNGTSTESAWTA